MQPKPNIKNKRVFFFPSLTTTSGDFSPRLFPQGWWFYATENVLGAINHQEPRIKRFLVDSSVKCEINEEDFQEERGAVQALRYGRFRRRDQFLQKRDCKPKDKPFKLA